MSLKEDMEGDLEIIYNTDEFAYPALYENSVISKEIIVMINNEIDIESINLHVISAKTKDVENLKEGDFFTINNVEYKCLNFEHQFDGFETIINLGLKK